MPPQVGQLGADVATDLIEELIQSTPKVINSVSKLLPKDFLAELAESIFDSMRRQINKLT